MLMKMDLYETGSKEVLLSTICLFAAFVLILFVLYVRLQVYHCMRVVGNDTTVSYSTLIANDMSV